MRAEGAGLTGRHAAQHHLTFAEGLTSASQGLFSSRLLLFGGRTPIQVPAFVRRACDRMIVLFGEEVRGASA
jgi:hypothetical protein